MEQFASWFQDGLFSELDYEEVGEGEDGEVEEAVYIRTVRPRRPRLARSMPLAP